MFVALRPPDDVLDHLEEFLEPRRAAAPFRWSLPDQVHVTLAFLPAVDDGDLDELVDRLTESVGRHRPFPTAIAGGGAFPDVARGRVLFADLALDDAARDQLGHLARSCRNAAVRAGVTADGQRFRPHLTLARCGRPTELTRWVRLLDGYRGPRWEVAEAQVLASHLGEGPQRRPRYDHVASLPMTGVG